MYGEPRYLITKHAVGEIIQAPEFSDPDRGPQWDHLTHRWVLVDMKPFAVGRDAFAVVMWTLAERVPEVLWRHQGDGAAAVESPPPECIVSVPST